jgi:pimeloyl-ACP methyl ester carboxylesterase
MSEAFAISDSRGALADIGGRALRFVRQGPDVGGATVLCEAGAFGFSADWSVVQERLAAKGVRSVAYDRAGLGLSDPGPEPRDGEAIIADLENLLAAIGDRGPWIACGHSMAGMFVRLLAARNRSKVKGVVLVDATTPEVMDLKPAAGFLEGFARASRLAAWGAESGLLRPLSGLGDSIGLTGAAKAEKRWAFAHGAHNLWAAAEVGQWAATAAEARAAGGFDPALPVAVVLAGAENSRAGWKAHLTAPALASRHGRVAHVRGASHASILGRRYADAVVEAIQWVGAAGAAC